MADVEKNVEQEKDDLEEPKVENHDLGDELKPMSKNQRKKMLKRQKKFEFRAENRKKAKLRMKERRQEMRDQGVQLPPSRKSLKRRKMVDSACQIPVVIDCSFDDLMGDKEVNYLMKQLQHSYSYNRRAPQPMQLHITSVGGKLEKRLNEVGDFPGWDVHKSPAFYRDIFPKDKIVYLSSESPNVLTELVDTKVYIIGGLVDHNHHKGLCYDNAVKAGIAHAQLPINEFIMMKTRKTMTIVHVFQILLKFSETGNWEESFFSVLPKRKGARPLGDAATPDDEDSADTKDLCDGASDCQDEESDCKDDESVSETKDKQCSEDRKTELCSDRTSENDNVGVEEEMESTS